MLPWAQNHVHLNVTTGGKRILALSLLLDVRSADAFSDAPAPLPLPPDTPLSAGSAGFLVRSLPTEKHLPVFAYTRSFIRYVPYQYKRYCVDLRSTFDSYAASLSSSTRAGIKRKIRRFEAHCGGKIAWKTYKDADEMLEYHRLARKVSAVTYQEKLLNAGLPLGVEFTQKMQASAAAGRVRGYVLFHNQEPVSYIYCPAINGTVLYQYVGYDPAYANWSVGTILQWLALQELFTEGGFHLFDFTEGDSDHKRQFATHAVSCADVYFLRPTVRNIITAHAHYTLNEISRGTGVLLDAAGLKRHVKKIIRKFS